MKYKVGDEVQIFQTNKKRRVKDILAYQADIWGTEAEMYELENEIGIYVDIYDGTVARA